MDSFEKHLEKYAEVAVKVGVNIQPGQTLLIRSDIEVAPFVRKVVKPHTIRGQNMFMWNGAIQKLQN